jgi:citrate synthase
MTQVSSNPIATSSSQAQSALEAFKAGLEGVVAGESKICLIDGENKRLSYRGINVADLAKFSTFE